MNNALTRRNFLKQTSFLTAGLTTLGSATLRAAKGPNDKIILGSGICGTVVNAEPKSIYVTIRVDESTNTKLRVLRSAIIRVGQPEEPATDGKEAG